MLYAAVELTPSFSIQIFKTYTKAQTKKDFITKMSISSNEARETKYWLMLIKETGIVKADVDNYLSQIDDLINILTKIVKTPQEKLK